MPPLTDRRGTWALDSPLTSSTSHQNFSPLVTGSSFPWRGTCCPTILPKIVSPLKTRPVEHSVPHHPPFLRHIPCSLLSPQDQACELLYTATCLTLPSHPTTALRDLFLLKRGHSLLVTAHRYCFLINSKINSQPTASLPCAFLNTSHTSLLL